MTKRPQNALEQAKNRSSSANNPIFVFEYMEICRDLSNFGLLKLTKHMRLSLSFFKRAAIALLPLVSIVIVGCKSKTGSGEGNPERRCHVTYEYDGQKETHEETYSMVAGVYRLVQYDSYRISYVMDEKSGLLQKVIFEDVMENGVVNSSFTAICDAEGHMIRGTVQIDGKEVVRVLCSYNDAGNLDYSEWTEGEGDRQYSMSDSFFWNDDGKDLISITRPTGTIDFFDSQKSKGKDITYRCPVVMAPTLSSMGWESLTQVLFGSGVLGPWFQEDVILGTSQFFKAEDEPYYQSSSKIEYGDTGIKTIEITESVRGYSSTVSNPKVTMVWE